MQRMRLGKRIAVIAAAVMLPMSLSAQNIMVQNNPWGQGSTLNAAMTGAFGAGNFTSRSYTGLSAASIFTAANRFIYLEGGDNTANTFNTFLATNWGVINGWVLAGGRLFLNAAPNEGGDILTPFGATIDYPGFSNNPVTMAGVLGGGQYNGSSFAHAEVINGGTALATSSAGVHLAGRNYGAGYVLTGGLTTPNFHTAVTGDMTALENYSNILRFAAAGGAVAVPEPSSALLLIAGLGGFVASRRRRAA